MKMPNHISIAFFWLCMSVFAPAQASTISGRIVDAQGAAIANARILIHWDSSGSKIGISDNIGIQQDISVLTDHSGKYEAAVPGGFYDLFVSGQAFTPTAAKVRVQPGQRITFDARLSVDPTVMKELGDQFGSPRP
jgi:Carboxypeptidase regulatory-like domain